MDDVVFSVGCFEIFKRTPGASGMNPRRSVATRRSPLRSQIQALPLLQKHPPEAGEQWAMQDLNLRPLACEASALAS